MHLGRREVSSHVSRVAVHSAELRSCVGKKLVPRDLRDDSAAASNIRYGWTRAGSGSDSVGGGPPLEEQAEHDAPDDGEQEADPDGEERGPAAARLASNQAEPGE